MRAWKNKQSETPPSMKKNVIIMCLLYFFTIYPLSLALTYIILQIYLFPISLIIAYRLNQKDLTHEREIPVEVDRKEFHVLGFRKLSIPFLGLLIFSIFGGIAFLFTLPAIIFIIYPKIYKKLFSIPKKLIVLSYPFFGFLSYIPGVNFKGSWFIEADSEIKFLKSSLDVLKFIFKNWKPFFVMNVGMSALMIRVLLFIRGDPPVQSIISVEALTSVGFFMVFWVVPLIMAPYFVWTWVWEDAELKVAQTKISTAGKDSLGEEIVETTSLTFASDSITNIFTLAFGIPSIVWMVDKMVTTDQLEQGGMFGLVVILIIFFMFSGVTTIFMGIMYYRSGFHEELVNNFRNEIKQSYSSKEDNLVKICSSTIQPVRLESV